MKSQDKTYQDHARENQVSRRGFLAALGSTGVAAFAWNPAFSAFSPLQEALNPLDHYPA